MGREVLGHGESLDLVLSEDLGHLLVGGEVLLVVRVLEVLLLEVGPQELHQLGPRRLLLADDGGELGAQLLGGGDSFSLLRHGSVVEVLGGLVKVLLELFAHEQTSPRFIPLSLASLDAKVASFSSKIAGHHDQGWHALS